MDSQTAALFRRSLVLFNLVPDVIAGRVSGDVFRGHVTEYEEAVMAASLPTGAEPTKEAFDQAVEASGLI